jgi:hypothetical protein
MNQNIDLDLVLDEWMHDGPNSVPDRVIDRVADQIDQEPQRLAWRLHGRPIVMTRTIQIAVALAAAVAIVFAGFALLPRPVLFVGGVTLTESPSPSAAASLGPTPIAGITPDPSETSLWTVTPDPNMVCEDNIPGCFGAEPAGFHRSWHLDPRVLFNLPDGSWTNSIDWTDIFKLDYGPNKDPSILVWANPLIAQQTPECGNTIRLGMSDATAWREFITTQPGVVAENLVPIDLVGTADSNGFEADLSLAPDWTQTCPGSDIPEIPFLAGRDQPPSRADYGVTANSRLHMLVVDGPLRTSAGNADVPSTMIVETYGPTDPTAYAQVVSTVEPVLRSMRFGCGIAVGYGPCAASAELPTATRPPF